MSCLCTYFFLLVAFLISLLRLYYASIQNLVRFVDSLFLVSVLLVPLCSRTRYARISLAFTLELPVIFRVGFSLPRSVLPHN